MNRYRFPERVKGTAAAAVVILHTFYALASFSKDFELAAVYCIRNLMQWAVPCFVMVTGALLLPPEKEITPAKLKKYLMRAGIALAAFSLIFALLDMVLLGGGIGDMLKNALSALFLGTGYRHMWYLYMLIALYLTLPLFRKLTAHSDEKELRYLLILLAVFQCLLPAVNTIFGIHNAFYIFIYTVYPLYLFAGYAVSAGKLKIEKNLTFILIAAFALGQVILTALDMKNVVPAKELAGSYSSPLAAAGALGIFALFTACEDKSFKADKTLKFISDNSLGIYLTHMGFLKIIAVKCGNILNNTNSIISGIIISIVVFGLSLGITAGFGKLMGLLRKKQ